MRFEPILRGLGLILCGLGAHRWRPGSPDPFERRPIHTCTRCYAERCQYCRRQANEQ